MLGIRAQLGYVQGFGGDVAPPNNRFYSGGEGDLRGFDIRGATPYGYVPNRVNVQLTNPDGSCVPRDPNNPQVSQCIQVPLPVYGIASDWRRHQPYDEPRIPHSDRRTGHLIDFFDDFGIDVALNHGQLKQSPEGFASLTAPLYGSRSSTTVPAEHSRGAGWLPAEYPAHCRNQLVPRMSTGAEISVIMPVINAPFRLYYAYDPLRLYGAAVLR